jgi:hypothetical protein
LRCEQAIDVPSITAGGIRTFEMAEGFLPDRATDYTPPVPVACRGARPEARAGVSSRPRAWG